jgi:hypothetical protein
VRKWLSPADDCADSQEWRTLYSDSVLRHPLSRQSLMTRLAEYTSTYAILQDSHESSCAFRLLALVLMLRQIAQGENPPEPPWPVSTDHNM